MRTTRQKHKSKAQEQEKRSARRVTKPKTAMVEIAFGNPEAAHHFLSWLCGSGEQAYWDWMECREQEEDGPITATGFDYHGPNGGKFGLLVKATCGRLERCS